MKRYLLALAGLAMAGLAGPVQARVDADPNREYVVTPADGAWMICTADFRGEAAAKQAHDLVLEVRGKYDLPAFVYDRTVEQRHQQQEEIARQKQQVRQFLERQGMRPEDVYVPVRTTRIEEERVVLIGSYRDMDSARKALDLIRKLKPPDSVPCERLNITTPSEGSALFGQGHAAASSGPEQVRQHEVNPFATGFVVHNPTVPMDKKQDQEDEARALRNLNSAESLSIYRCRKPWTLALASYQGHAVVASNTAPKSFLERMFGSGDSDQLSAAAQNAHSLAEVLRKLDFDAYVFHTRYRSVVTVGGFDTRDDPRMTELHRVLMTRLKKDPRVSLPFFEQVIPMEVPQ